MYSKLNEVIIMIAIRLSQDIEKRLDKLAKVTGRTKTFYAREAILSYLDDMEDIYLASERLKKPRKIYTQEEVEKMLELDR
jgi:RHH-type rel operon transcriptional repressor/antitoxin RelB